MSPIGFNMDIGLGLCRADLLLDILRSLLSSIG
jgi:hypothetical protein